MPVESLPQDTALLVVDVQLGLDDPSYGTRNNPEAELRMAELLTAWRASGRPVYHVQHMSREPASPLRPGMPGNAIKPEVAPQPGEPLFRKEVNSAFIGTGLEEALRRDGRNALVVIGLTTEHCVSTTVRMAGNLGFTTFVVADATAAFDKQDRNGRRWAATEVHELTLATLDGEFATVVTTDELLELVGPYG